MTEGAAAALHAHTACLTLAAGLSAAQLKSESRRQRGLLARSGRRGCGEAAAHLAGDALALAAVHRRDCAAASSTLQPLFPVTEVPQVPRRPQAGARLQVAVIRRPSGEPFTCEHCYKPLGSIGHTCNELQPPLPFTLLTGLSISPPLSALSGTSLALCMSISRRLRRHTMSSATERAAVLAGHFLPDQTHQVSRLPATAAASDTGSSVQGSADTPSPACRHRLPLPPGSPPLVPWLCLQGQPQLTAHPTSAPNGGFNVAVLGAAGGIGQPLSLLLKL